MTQPDTQIAHAPPAAGVASEQIETATTAPAAPQSGPADDLVEDDLLVEDVSIDGMCGVY
jgi:mycofactocin precursor